MKLTRIFAYLLAALQLLFFNVTYGPWGPAADSPPPPPAPGNDITGDSTLSPSVLYAAQLQNQAQGYYTDASRGSFVLQNTGATLTHDLQSGKRAALQSPSGGTYLRDTMDVFYTAGGKTWYAADSIKTGRVNVIRLGLYYLEAHVRDLNFALLSGGAFWADKTYHIYGDRLYQELALYASKATTALERFGLEVKIPVSDVTSYTNVDAYAAFAIKDVGVVGFIFPSDGSCGAVTLTTEGGNYVLRQYAKYTPGDPVRANDESGTGLYSLRFGNRIYTDDTQDFAGITAAAAQERSPLTAADITVTGGNANARFLGYDALRGSYTFRMDSATGFDDPYYNEPDKHFAAPLSFTSPDDHDIYVRMNSTFGGLEASALLDDKGLLAPLPVEVCKNFQGDGGEPFYSVIDYQYGDSFFPLRLQGGEELSLTLLNLYQNWGKFPLKQLSSIEFHVSYYHLSTGVTESNCIAPYFAYPGRIFLRQLDGWVLPDFRGRSGIMWPEQPQFNSVGRLHFVGYQRSVLKNLKSEYLGSRIDSAGLSYADITTFYRSDCGSYDYSLRHTEFPQTDENRTYYTLDLTFNRDMTFQNARRDFELFSFDGREVSFKQIGWLDENNQPQTRAFQQPLLSLLTPTQYIPLGDECPYFSYFDMARPSSVPSNAGSAFSLIVRNSEITVGGAPFEGGLAFKSDGVALMNSAIGITNVGALTLNAKRLEFKAGDHIRLDLILLPWGTGFETDDANARAVREDSALHPLALTASVGTVVTDAVLPTIACDNGLAQFTLSGGANNSSVRVNGFASPVCPALERSNGGTWEPVDLASANGYDGYTVFYNPATGLYDFAFVLETPGTAVEYRVGY